ncbi:hypothetical protein [Paenibacillus polymyxa]|uniref:Uncharacterized protein n=1 Tax=Paenibacillus polymyxa (strain SC2) TaxID=886882 RepID=E3EKV1_PAEPS|nr:hypothetical protein [Paenibacillus polymyxa]ADO59552.1 hypothetical protein PPSC2_27335 [Paenibacillus polymyxa SC2]WPQ59616.1 hypothetical protein SKN87_28560 [Paenibacillus polymyxa]
MVATMNKGFKMTVAIGMLMAMLFVFFSPTLAFAADGESKSSIPGVTISEDGSVTVKGDGFGEKGTSSGFAGIIEKYRGFIAGISGVAALTMIVIFIINFLKLGASVGNPQARSQALTGVLWSGIAAAGLGAVSLIVGLFYNAI